LFILKAHYNPEDALRERLGSEIGKNIVNINEVQIFSYTEIESLCPDIAIESQEHNQVFTLHTYIKGEFLDDNLIFRAINEKKHLKNIAYNDHSLAQIAAFNLFINNWDCHRGNLLKDEKTNQFHVIDMDHAFIDNYRHSLATTTDNYLKTIKKRKLSPDIIKALKIFNDTLSRLIDLYSPETVYNLWIQIAVELNLPYNEIIKNNLSIAIHDYFNEIKKVHCCINYLTAKPTLIENISNNVLDASFYSFKKLNTLSKNTLYMGILGASDISCRILKIAFNEADKLNKNIVKLQKKLHTRVVL
jgi:hypothetical protein